MDPPKPGHRFFKELPPKMERPLVNVDDFVHGGIHGKENLADYRSVVDAERNFVNGHAVFLFVILQCPIDGIDASIARQRTIMDVEDLVAFIDEPLPN